MTAPGRGAITAVAGAVWLALALWAAPGLFVVDEFIYLAAAEAFADARTLMIDNGWSRFHSQDLRLQELLAPGPNGMTSQYPAGYTILIAPLVAMLGVNGAMALNAVAAAGCVWLTWRLAEALFGDPRLARAAALILIFSTFLTEYAVAALPHALSAFIVLAIACLGVRASAAAGRSAQGFALASGLLLGAGLLIRADVSLIGPPLAAAILLFAPRPLSLAAPAALGLAPGLIAASALNQFKFGVFFPISYGDEPGTGADPRTYLAIGALAFAALGLALALRRADWRRPLAAALALAAAIAAAAIVLRLHPAAEAAGGAFSRLAQGAYALFIDIRTTAEVRPGIVRLDDGRVLFWGLTKKALGQSLPWIGVIAALALRRPAREDRFGLALCLLVVVFWASPFARTAWHGGYAANMRYFLPLAPFVAILAAAAMRAIRPARPGPWRAVGVAGGAALIVAAAAGPHFEARLANEAAPYLLLAVAVAAAAATWLQPIRGAATALTVAALTVAAFIAFAFDLQHSLKRRAFHAVVEARIDHLPDDALIYAVVAEPYMFHLRRGRGPLAMAGRFNADVDPALIAAALDEGRPVFVQSERLARRAAEAAPGLTIRAEVDRIGWFRPIYRIEQAPVAE